MSDISEAVAAIEADVYITPTEKMLLKCLKMIVVEFNGRKESFDIAIDGAAEQHGDLEHEIEELKEQISKLKKKLNLAKKLGKRGRVDAKKSN